MSIGKCQSRGDLLNLRGEAVMQRGFTKINVRRIVSSPSETIISMVIGEMA